MDTSRVAAAVPLSDDRFLVFLEDGRMMEGQVSDGELEWTKREGGVPGTDAGEGPREVRWA